MLLPGRKDNTKNTTIVGSVDRLDEVERQLMSTNIVNARRY